MSKKRHNTSSGLKSSPEHIELKRLKALVTQLKKENELLINELERIRSFSRKHIDKALLEKHIREGKTNKQLAKIFKVSTRTIARRVKEYRLKGLRKPGKRKLKTLIQSEDKGNWISVERYMDKLNRKYNFANVQYPHTK
ncbi:MAG: hypothetical protein JXA99_10590, partial [Candidatus Lokiarchaeota archaeon]|nr:hypothetical protein [Candidatus Lokiarchaeota archaeon]